MFSRIFEEYGINGLCFDWDRNCGTLVPVIQMLFDVTQISSLSYRISTWISISISLSSTTAIVLSIFLTATAIISDWERMEWPITMAPGRMNRLPINYQCRAIYPVWFLPELAEGVEHWLFIEFPFLLIHNDRRVHEVVYPIGSSLRIESDIPIYPSRYRMSKVLIGLWIGGAMLIRITSKISFAYHIARVKFPSETPAVSVIQAWILWISDGPLD